MSCLLYGADIPSITSNIINGFDISDLQDSESIDSIKDNGIARGSLKDLMQDSSSFGFINNEASEKLSSWLAENDVVSEDADINEIEASDGSELLSGTSNQDSFVLEFFDDGVNISDFTVGEDKIVIKGMSDDADVQYDEISGKLSVDGKELAQLDAGLNLNDDSYEIF